MIKNHFVMKQKLSNFGVENLLPQHHNTTTPQHLKSRWRQKFLWMFLLLTILSNQGFSKILHKNLEPGFLIACPDDWNVCIDLIGTEGCEHTFAITFSGFPSPYSIGALTTSFSISSGIGTITSAIFVNVNEPFASQGFLNFTSSNVNYSFFSNSTTLDGSQVNGTKIYVTVMGTIGTCFTLTRGNTRHFENISTFCNSPEDCPPLEVCTEGVTIFGNVSAADIVGADCPDTENLGIEGVDISVTGANGSCNATTDNAGDYSCQLCEGEPYEVCVNTTCENGCGLDEFDLFYIQQMILDVLQGTIKNWFVADVNQDGKVNHLDLGQINAEILGLPNSVSNWCRFIPNTDLLNFISANPTWNTGQVVTNTPPVVDACITVTNPAAAVNFTRYMLGDHNGSCDDCIHGDDEGDIPRVASVYINNNGNTVKSLRFSEDQNLLSAYIVLESTDIDDITHVFSLLPGFSYQRVSNKIVCSWFETTSVKNVVHIQKDQPFITIIHKNNQNFSVTLSTENKNLMMNQTGEIFSLNAENTELRDPDSSILFPVFKDVKIPMVGDNLNAEVTIISTNGIVLYHNQKVDILSSLEEVYNVLVPGMYILKIDNDQNQIRTKFFVNRP
jgi:hypothetical protein